MSDQRLYTWKNFSGYVYSPPIRGMLIWAGLGVLALFTAIAVSSPLIGLMGAAMLVFPVAFIFPWKSRLSQSSSAVVARKPKWYRNMLVWAAAEFVLLTVVFVIGVIQEPRQLFRFAVGIVCGIAGIALLAVFMFRDRGPLELSARSVTFGNGRVCDFARVHIDVEIQSNGVPVALLHDLGEGGSRKPARLLGTAYQLNFNSLASTVIQLQTWCLDGRETTPDEIMAMLTVEPPRDVDVGESVQLALPVQARS